MRFRQKAGELSGFVLESLRRPSETLQYGQRQPPCRDERETDALPEDESRLKKTAGFNQAMTQSVMILFDLAMLFTSAALYRSGSVGFAGVVIPTVALMSSDRRRRSPAWEACFRILAAGSRVLDILDETPVTEEVTGKAPIGFEGAGTSEVSATATK